MSKAPFNWKQRDYRNATAILPKCQEAVAFLDTFPKVTFRCTASILNSWGYLFPRISHLYCGSSKLVATKPYQTGSAYDFSFQSLQGGKLPLSAYAGKVLLIVNTASKCGFTSQYRAIETLYQRYKDQGLVIIGVPCNDFAHQEPGSSEEIAQFCERHYGVTFPMAQKEHVRGAHQHPFYAWAKQTLGFGTGPKWNFHKYLIDRQGQLVDYFHSTTSPKSKRFIAALDARIRDPKT